MEPKDISDRIDGILSQLVALKSEILAGEPVFPAWAQELVDNRVCLICKKRIALTDTPNRGNHERHYRQVKRAIDRGELTEAEAIALGKLAPRKVAGRPRSTPLIIEQAEQDIEKRRSGKKTPPS